MLHPEYQNCNLLDIVVYNHRPFHYHTLVKTGCKILYENKEAYVKTDYLSIIEDVTKLTPVGVLEAKDTVNVRMAPTVDSDRIGTTYVGEKVDYFEIDDNGWAKVNYNQSVGYVKAEYFNKE